MQQNTDQKNSENGHFSLSEKKEQIIITPFCICSTVAPLILQIIKKN